MRWDSASRHRHPKSFHPIQMGCCQAFQMALETSALVLHMHVDIFMNYSVITPELISTCVFCDSCGQIPLPMCRQAVYFQVLCISSPVSSSKTSQVSCKSLVLFSHPLWFSLWCSHTLELSEWHNLLILSNFFLPFTAQFPRLHSALQAYQFKEPTAYWNMCWITHIHFSSGLCPASLLSASPELTHT